MVGIVWVVWGTRVFLCRCPIVKRWHVLPDVGRAELERRTERRTERHIERPAPERLLRKSLRRTIANPAGFDALPETGRAMRPFLPAALGRKIPNRTARAKTGPALGTLRCVTGLNL